MIPKILLINEVENSNEVISQFAIQNHIDPSYRIVVSPEKEDLTVDQIRQLKKDIQVSFSKIVLVVLRGVDDSSNEVQNSLLKCLEEDADRILFLFLVKNPARLLPTILSRCSISENMILDRSTAPSENYNSMFALKRNSEVTKDEAVKRIDQFMQTSYLTNLTVLRHLLLIRKLIIDNNMNPVLALDNILLFFSKTSTMSNVHDT